MALALVITTAGRAALRNADGSGTRAVRIAAVGVSAAALAPTAATAALPGEIKRITTLSGDAVAADIIHLVVRDETMATYTVRSFALYLDDGTLFAAYGQPDPIIEKSAQALLLLSLDVTLADITATSITFGNADFLMPPATVDRQGLIELATEAEAAAGTDRTRAVTPYALRVTFGDVWRASNDGAGSGLDADLLDGRQGADYALLTGAAFTGVVAAPAFQASTPGFGGVALLPGGAAAHGYVSFRNAGNTQTGLIGSHGFGGALIYSCTAGHYFDANVGVQGGLNVVAGLTVNANTVWHAGNDGAGSGCDADLLDGRQGTDYALLTGAAFSGVVAAPAVQASTPGFGGVALLPGGAAAHGYVSFRNAGNAQTGLIGSHGFGAALIYSCTAGHYFDANVGVQGGLNVVAGITVNANTVWHAGNDGAGSGCDADLLDGQQGSWYADILARLGFTPLNAAVYTGRDIVARLVTADGAGSGLDADLLDGRQATEFPLLTGAAFTGTVTAPAFQASTPGAGSIALLPGGATGNGYVSFRNAGNVQTGLIGSHGFGAALIYSCTAGHYFDANVGVQGGLNVVAGLTVNANTVWHAGNDGAGSGCDADLLDGQQGDWYRRWANLLDVPGAFPPSAHAHGAADLAGAFAGSLAENGYTVLPNGLILQWMTGPMQAARTSAATYLQWPVAFPTACFQAFVSAQMQQAGDRGDSWFQLVGAPDQNGATIQRQASGTADDIVASAPRLFAIGM